jgi:hypothetical protein
MISYKTWRLNFRWMKPWNMWISVTASSRNRTTAGRFVVISSTDWQRKDGMVLWWCIGRKTDISCLTYNPGVCPNNWGESWRVRVSVNGVWTEIARIWSRNLKKEAMISREKSACLRTTLLCSPEDWFSYSIVYIQQRYIPFKRDSNL